MAPVRPSPQVPQQKDRAEKSLVITYPASERSSSTEANYGGIKTGCLQKVGSFKVEDHRNHLNGWFSHTKPPQLHQEEVQGWRVGDRQ